METQQVTEQQQQVIHKVLWDWEVWVKMKFNCEGFSGLGIFWKCIQIHPKVFFCEKCVAVMTDGVGCDLCEGTESWIKIFMCVCVHPYQHLQDGGEGLSVLRDTADVKRSGENRRVVVLVLDVDDDLRCVGWDTQGELTLMRHIYTLRHCFCLPEARYQHPAMNLHWTCERYWYFVTSQWDDFQNSVFQLSLYEKLSEETEATDRIFSFVGTSLTTLHLTHTLHLKTRSCVVATPSGQVRSGQVTWFGAYSSEILTLVSM